MRKLAVFHNLPSGGALRVLHDKMRVMKERGYTISLYSFSSAEQDFLPLGTWADRVVVETLRFEGPSRFENYDRATRRIAEAINASDAEWVLIGKCRYFGSPPVLRYLKKPHIFYSQEPLRIGPYEALANGNAAIHLTGWLEFFRQPLRQQIRKIISLPDRAHIKGEDRRSMWAAKRVMTNSRFTASWIKRVYGVEPLVNYQGVDTERFSPGEASVPKTHVLSVGRMDPFKGHDFLIRALALIPESRRPKLVIICDAIRPSFLKKCGEEASRTGVEIEVRHRVSEEELQAAYHGSALVLCASVREPFGLVPLEAMACAVPVLAVKEGGFLETIVDGKTGFILERDESLWARKIEACLADPDAMRRMGEAGRSEVLSRWTWGPFMDRMERVVQEDLGIPARNRNEEGRKMEPGKVSIILPSYNYQQFISEAVDSVLAQTYQKWELIIVDDGSSDASPEILKRYEREFPGKIRVYFHEGRLNKGLIETYRLGLEKCTSDYVAFIEADDVWLPENLAQKVAVLERHPDVAVVHSGVEMFGDDGLIRSLNEQYHWRKFLDSEIADKPFYAFPYLLHYNFILTFSSFVTRKKSLDGIDFSAKHDAWFDWWLLAQLSLKGRFFYLPEAHLKWRVHAQSYNLIYSRSVDEYREGLLFKDRISAHMGEHLKRSGGRNGGDELVSRLKDVMRRETLWRMPRRLTAAVKGALKKRLPGEWLEKLKRYAAPGR